VGNTLIIPLTIPLPKLTASVNPLNVPIRLLKSRSLILSIYGETSIPMNDEISLVASLEITPIKPLLPYTFFNDDAWSITFSICLASGYTVSLLTLFKMNSKRGLSV